MARQNKGPGERGSRGRVKEENDRENGRNNSTYESGVYGDYDDGGYDDADYEFEGGYDDEEYEDYDTSFDEDDGSWARRQEQFEGVTRDERRRKLIRGLYQRSKRRQSDDHRGEFNEGYESEYEREFDHEYEERGRKGQSVVGKRSAVRSRRSTVGRRQSAVSGKHKTSARTKSRKRTKSSSSALRTRVNGSGRKSLAGMTKTRRKRSNSSKTSRKK